MINPITKIFEKTTTGIYHYTTQEGLIGIIEKRSIWATQIQYLNDTQEFKLRFVLLVHYLVKRPMSLFTKLILLSW